MWQARLEKLVRLGRQMPPPLNFFTAARPLSSPWPAGLPSCPTLKEFYRLCNGGWFGGGLALYQFLPRGKLAGEVRHWRGKLWVGDTTLDDSFLVLALDDIGGLFWEASTDRLHHFDLERGTELLPDASTADFFERLFDPERAEGQAAAEWAQALRWLDAHA